MSIRRLALAGLAAALATAASAQETTPAPAPTTTAAPSDAAPAPDAEARQGEKEWKERINIVARKPRRHDINWVDGRDRTGWRDFTVWYGIRDERPMVARKTHGFHERDPYVRRAERVERVSRGPLRGPAPSE